MSDATHIKICGLTSTDEAQWCVEAGASSIGLNLVPASPRCIDRAVARAIAHALEGRAESVLVVADLSVEQMRELLDQTGASCVQMHGHEPPDTVAALLPRAYKAVRVATAEDLELADRYPGEYLLVDAKVPGQLGGTGQTVDFNLVAPLARRRRLVLAGGLRPDNVANAVERVRPYCVDVASGVEPVGEPRRKDRGLVARFVAEVRRADAKRSATTLA